MTMPLDPAAGPGGSPERRAEPRQLCTQRPVIPVTIRPTFINRRALARDCGRYGIGLLFPDPLEPGTSVALLVPTAGLGSPRMVLATVVHATPSPEGGYVLGCALAMPLEDDELHALLW